MGPEMSSMIIILKSVFFTVFIWKRAVLIALLVACGGKFFGDKTVGANI